MHGNVNKVKSGLKKDLSVLISIQMRRQYVVFQYRRRYLAE